MVDGLTVRKATPADRDAVVALCRAIDEHDYVPELFDWAVTVAEPKGLYVAELEGRIVGCHSLDVTAPGTAFFFAMRVDPRVQGHGIGSAYARLQVEHAAAAGLRHLFLTSALWNVRAHRTVERNGFVNRGGWVTWEKAAVGPRPEAVATALQARPGTPADLPRVVAFQAALAGEVLATVRPASDFLFGFAKLHDEDWAGDDLVVVDGPGGLEGVMLLRQIDVDGPNVYIRRLEGTPEAAAALLDYARNWAVARGLEKWCVSLPARCEALLAPLGLDPAKAERWYMFEYEAK